MAKENKKLKKIALDTNILVFASNKNSAYHGFCKKLILDGLNGKFALCIADKTFYELFAVLSNIQGPDQATQVVQFYLEKDNFELLHSTPKTASVVLELIKDKKIKGKYIHDLVLIAMLYEQNIDAICTNNVKDFSGFSNLEVINPVVVS